MSLVILRLGGSVVTDKDEPGTIDEAGLATTVGAVAPPAELRCVVIIHDGGGSGHHHAAEHGVSSGSESHDARGVYVIHDVMKRPNDAVLDALKERDVVALSVHPLLVGVREADGSLSLPLVATETMLDEGPVPVPHGDVISHTGKGATIVSGDDFVVSLASGLSADRVGPCSTVPDVFDADNGVTPEITALAGMANTLGRPGSTDTTGRMAVKVRKLLTLDASVHVSDPERPLMFVAGESSRTVIHGG